MPNKTFSRLTENEYEQVKDFIQYMKDTFNLDTDNQALLRMIQLTKNAIDQITYNGVEYKTPTDIAIERICESGFLKKIVEPRTGKSLWSCLRSKKPLLLADGIDETSIRYLCASCKQRDYFQLQKSLGQRAIEQIHAFGDSKISIDVYACKHPEMRFIQVLLGKGEFHCKKFDVMKDVIKFCIGSENCTFLISDVKEIFIKETKAYQELQQALEDKRG